MSAPQVFLTETRERFLKAVVAELPAERIRELYLFAPIRQGGVESGVAVVAAELPESTESAGSESAAFGTDTPPDSDASVEEPHLGELTGHQNEAEVCAVDPGTAGPEGANPDRDPADSDPSDPETTPGSAPAPRPPAPDPRYTVYTARYRHTQKGPDRGKWESSVVAEADAPLLSIETVVRGVQRRSGDVDPPDHMSGDEVRSALRITPQAAEP